EAGQASVAAVAEIIARHCRPGPIVRVPLRAAAGCVLAEPIRADRDYPAFDKSMVDGYAVRSQDVALPPADLLVAGEIAAGASASQALESGQAIRINTGAPVPAGSDSVVMVERTTALDDGHRVRI